ncbi:FHA domain-containing protein [Streptomyces sp. 4N509B]|uniref:FHA domain-containing protein n=1 Tax=Streptomyces sp. 4N509B TaxID=3457413 RepID=UPI003FD527CE
MPIQISVTVLGHTAGRGAPGGGEGEGVDVRLTAPEDTPLAEVLGTLASVVTPGSGTPGAVFCGERRLDPRSAVLGRAPLVDGAVLSFHRPAATPVPERVPARLLVVSGPDAGGVHLLRGGEVRIGRSVQADVPLDDPDVSRLHCAVSIHADGTVTVADLGSTNGTLLGGEPVTDRPVVVPPGAPLRLGESTVRVISEGPVGDGAPSAPGFTGPTTPASRSAAAPASGSAPSGPPVAGPGGPPVPPAAPPPRPPAPSAPSTAPALPLAEPDGPGTDGPGTGGRRTGRGLAGWARRRGAPASGGDTHTSVALPSASSSRPTGGTRPWPAHDPAEDARWPDLATLLLLALEPERPRQPRLWERGPAHPDAYGLRLGTAQRAQGRISPVGLSLPTIGSLGLAGPRQRLLGLARSLLAQLAALHPPSALELVVVAPDRAAEWSWLGWLPHLRPTRGQACRQLVGFDVEQATARVRELAERESPDPTGRRTVLLVDEDALDASPPGAAHTLGTSRAADAVAELRRALARLAATGAGLGVHLLCLTQSPPATPASPLADTLALARRSSPTFAACGTVGLLSGAVASALRLSGAGVTPGRGDGAGPVVTVDAVSAAWAERFARALAPVREDAREAFVAAGSAAPPPSCRLLDALELHRVTPGALRERWERPGGLPLVLGAAAGGAALVDLAETAGPVRIEGERSSGRTELLCSLAASLAAARGPRDLSLLLVEGAGEGLRPCAELPHVASHLGANDPVRMRAFAQALRDELKRRAALLGESVFPGAPAALGGVGRQGGRVVGPRGPVGEPAPSAHEGLPRESPAGDVDPSVPRIRAAGSGPLPWLVVLVDDVDALVAPPLGAPGRQAAGSVVRALGAAAREGHRLGVRVIVAGAPGVELPQDVPRAEARVLLTGPPAGRAELRLGGGAPLPFQAARVTGRIPRTATLRPTVTRLDWARAGDPPTRRPVRELGNGPTDVALLASAASRAARSDRATTASLV